jgi:hypothetical protein
VLTIVDNFMRVSRRPTCGRATTAPTWLEPIASVYGRPRRIGVDNGPEAVRGAGGRRRGSGTPNPCENVDFHGTRRRDVSAGGPAGVGPRGRLGPVPGPAGYAPVPAADRHAPDRDRRGDGVAPRPRPLLPQGAEPEGRGRRAFDVPLSGPLLDLVRHRLEENRAVAPRSPWLFPSGGAAGHVAEVKQDELGRLLGHALRHLYASLAMEAGVPIAELKFLLNHSVSSGGMTMGYLHPSLDYLRGWQEKTSERVLAAVGLAWEPGRWPPAPSGRPLP